MGGVSATPKTKAKNKRPRVRTRLKNAFFSVVSIHQYPVIIFGGRGGILLARLTLVRRGSQPPPPQPFRSQPAPDVASTLVTAEASTGGRANQQRRGNTTLIQAERSGGQNTDSQPNACALTRHTPLNRSIQDVQVFTKLSGLCMLIDDFVVQYVADPT